MSDPVQLKKLQAKWYAKLKTEGFEDIEREDGSLTTWASSAFSQAVRAGQVEAMKSREEYYRAAGQFLWDYTFDSDLERKIWEMHSTGMSALAISKTLKLPRKGKDTILKAINKLAKIMGVKCRS